MKMKFRHIAIVASGLLYGATALAQQETRKITFVGAARAQFYGDHYQSYYEEDTVTTAKLNSGNTLVDLGINIRPNPQMEIQGMVRVRNDYGGFWGAGVSFDVRQLYVKGVAGGIVRYQLGDINYKLTPYTLWNSNQEMITGVPFLLQQQTDVVNYDHFYNNDNSWRQQGASAEVAFEFGKWIKEIGIKTVATRVKTSDFSQTNDRIFKWASVGGWAGYGFGDKRWKYGGFAEFYFDRYKEFVLRGSYADDLGDPGRIQIAKEMDKNYLRRFLLARVDLTKTYTVSLNKKFGYWSAELAGEDQQFTPNYNYALSIDGKDYASFRSREVSLNLRYAYGERTAPVFGTYMRTDSKYPVWFGKVTGGEITAGMPNERYIKAVSGLLWKGHLNRIGTEHLMLEAGKIWSDNALPISRLFAGNGFKYDPRYAFSLYGFGGIMTLFPYEVYTDRFAQAIFRHDMDWKLYKLEASDFNISSAPNLAIQYGVLFGNLWNAGAHKSIDIMIPDKGYHEAGILLNNLIRLRSKTYYQSFNIGYFYNVSAVGPIDPDKNGKIVIGASIEL